MPPKLRIVARRVRAAIRSVSEGRGRLSRFHAYFVKHPPQVFIRTKRRIGPNFRRALDNFPSPPQGSPDTSNGTPTLSTSDETPAESSTAVCPLSLVTSASAPASNTYLSTSPPRSSAG